MIKVVILGSGNVAQHLIKAFAKSDAVTVIQAYARNKNNLNHLLDSQQITDNFSSLKEADLYIIAVADEAINSVSKQIPFSNKLVAHTSGSVAINELSNSNRKGVFYPLQTLSKKKEVDFKQVPLCLEAENESDLKLLKKVASSISDKLFEIDSNQRKSLHLSAVFVSNFVNHLYEIGNQICAEHNVPFDILKPLIQETAQKVQTLLPKEAQTGPAKRNDTVTLNKHLQMLSNLNHKEIYKLLTKSIIDNEQKL